MSCIIVVASAVASLYMWSCCFGTVQTPNSEWLEINKTIWHIALPDELEREEEDEDDT